MDPSPRLKPEEIAPDAGKNYQLEPQLAFFIDSLHHPLHASFFDLNLFLGLERKGFLSVLAGYRSNNILENLRAVETLLWHTMREGKLLHLPTRWWTKLIFNRSLRPPSEESEVWTQIVGDDDISKCLHNGGLPDFAIPGIILEVEDNQHCDGITEELLASIINWCQCLAKDIFKDSVAIIINLHFRPTEFASIKENVGKISQNLRHLTEELNGSKRILNISLRKTCEHIYGFSKCRTETWPSGQEKEAIKGWIGSIAENSDKAPEEILRNYLDLKLLYNGRWSHQQIKAESKITVTEQRAKETNEDFDLSNQLVYFQLLSLTEEFLPEKVCSLINTYACSDCLAMDFQTLAFAKMFDNNVVSDMLIDVWIQDRDPSLCAKQIQNGLSSAVSSRTGSFIDDFALAILRRFSKTSSEKETLAKITNSICHLLSRNLQEIADFHLTKRDVENQEFLARLASDEDFFSLAIRSGIDITKVLDSCTYRGDDFIAIRFVCQISATQYLQDTFREVLSLDEISRAYLGLCTTESFYNISYEIREQIISWRNY